MLPPALLQQSPLSPPPKKTPCSAQNGHMFHPAACLLHTQAACRVSIAGKAQCVLSGVMWWRAIAISKNQSHQSAALSKPQTKTMPAGLAGPDNHVSLNYPTLMVSCCTPQAASRVSTGEASGCCVSVGMVEHLKPYTQASLLPPQQHCQNHSHSILALLDQPKAHETLSTFCQPYLQ
jgi:hypothetical protein